MRIIYEGSQVWKERMVTHINFHLLLIVLINTRAIIYQIDTLLHTVLGILQTCIKS